MQLHYIYIPLINYILFYYNIIIIIIIIITIIIIIIIIIIITITIIIIIIYNYNILHAKLIMALLSIAYNFYIIKKLL